MKKLLILLLSIVVLSCKHENPAPEKEMVKYERPDILGQTYSECVHDDVPAPTDYTGLFGDSLILSAPGYGIYADSAYDKGYRAGYEDALFYHQYFEYTGYPNCGSFAMYKTVRDEATGQYSNHPLSYTLQAGQVASGISIVLQTSETCGYDFLLKRCVLLNSSSPKGLRLQYQFNKDHGFTGKTAVQQSYDMGRWQGFYNGVNLQPLTAAI